MRILPVSADGEKADGSGQVSKLDLLELSGVPAFMLSKVLPQMENTPQLGGLPIDLVITDKDNKPSPKRSLRLAWDGGSEQVTTDSEGNLHLKVTSKNCKGLALEIPKGLQAKKIGGIAMRGGPGMEGFAPGGGFPPGGFGPAGPVPGGGGFPPGGFGPAGPIPAGGFLPGGFGPGGPVPGGPLPVGGGYPPGGAFPQGGFGPGGGFPPGAGLAMLPPGAIETGAKAPALEVGALLNAPKDARLKWSALKGKTVVLEFWSTQCAPCVAVIPHLNELHDALTTNDVVFLSVTTDDEKTVKEFLKKHPMKSWIGVNAQGTFAAYRAFAIPVTYVIADGTVQGVFDPRQLTVETIRKLCAAAPSKVDETKSDSPANGPGLAELRQREKEAKKAIPDCVAATVGLLAKDGMGEGSGVIVSADGIILSAAHILQKPGRRFSVRLSDGSVGEAEALGIIYQADLGLARLTKSGPWPFRPIADWSELKAGDWVMAAGHSDGYRPKRLAPVRLGQILALDRVRRELKTGDTEYDPLLGILTNCRIYLGDSGGPLFDLQGRVLGVNSSGMLPVPCSHSPAALTKTCWKQLLDGKEFGTPLRMDSPGRGPSTGPTSVEAHARILKVADDYAKRLAAVAASFDQQAAAVVQLESGDHELCLGTIVDPDGWVVSKASVLGDRSQVDCSLKFGLTLTADIVGRDEKNDLALLRVPARNLPSVHWTGAAPARGAFVHCPKLATNGSAVGWIGTDTMELPLERARNNQKVQLGLGFGSAESRVFAILPGSPAEKAGFKVKDLILSVDGVAITAAEQLSGCLEGKAVGDMLTVVVARDQEKATLSLKLGAAQPLPGGGPAGGLNPPGGRCSERCTGFAAVFAHDGDVDAAACGGPVLDLDGRALGINIARYSPSTTYALPAEVVRQCINDLRAKVRH
jgi:serine protease Do